MPLGFWTMCIVSCFGFTSVWSLSNIGPAYLTHYNQSHGLQPDSPYIVNLSTHCMCLCFRIMPSFTSVVPGNCCVVTMHVMYTDL